MLDHEEGSPAIVFDDVPGYPSGRRVIVNCNGPPPRQAVTLCLPPEQGTHEGLFAYWRATLDGLRPLQPREVADGPILENVFEGDAIDLAAFPAPVWHPKDGGRFIGTASLNILRDPDSDWVNVASYRNQIFAKDELGMWISPGKHGRFIREKYFERKQRCPVVVVVGCDPLLFMAACAEGLAYGQAELAWAGGGRGEPVEVVRGKHTGLPIPAWAEIAIEGFMDPVGRHPEGPYGEWLGYYASSEGATPGVRVAAVYHRNDPIILGCPQGKPPHEDNRFLAYLRSGMIWDQLEKAGVPDVTGVWSPPAGGNRLMTVVAIKTQYLGHSKQAGLIASQCAGAVEMNRLTVVVDDHVDVTNLQDVVWAILARCDPERGVEIIKDTKGSRIDMAIAPDRRELNANSRMIIDATTPFAWKSHPLAGDIISTPERTRAILATWGWVLDR